MRDTYVGSHVPKDGGGKGMRGEILSPGLSVPLKIIPSLKYLI